MPVQGEDKMVESPTQTDSEKNTKKRRRIPRACDRCRLKKSKCDGAKVCRTCQETDSVCLYRSRKSKEGRNYYWYMRDITDEALIRLYWACQNGTGFPGRAPQPKDDQITAHAILEGLGLTGPLEDDLANNTLQSSPPRTVYPLKALRRESITPPLTPDESTTSANINNLKIDFKSRTNSADSIAIASTPESTRLQRQFQKQLQTPSTSVVNHSGPGTVEALAERFVTDATTHAYPDYDDNGRGVSKPPTQSDASRFDSSLLLKMDSHPGDGLIASQFFDFETAGITPGLNLDTFDFTYTHDFSGRFAV